MDSPQPVDWDQAVTEALGSIRFIDIHTHLFASHFRYVKPMGDR